MHGHMNVKLHQLIHSHALDLGSILYIPPFSKEFSLLFFFETYQPQQQVLYRVQ
jgi:hypothetical protein